MFCEKGRVDPVTVRLAYLWPGIMCKNEETRNPIFHDKQPVMKPIMKTWLLPALLLVMAFSWQPAAAQRYGDDYRGEVDFQTFYDELSPYGQWIDYPGYGYAWVPDAGPDFQPYSTNGHWVWSEEEEWLWVSDYDWGWAPFHYGRWMDDPYYGWVWIPGTEWSPAWVAWRDGGDYYGWAPLGPQVTVNVNFNIGAYNPPIHYWSFVPRRYILSPRVWDYYIDRRQNVTIVSYTTVINNYYYGDRWGFRTGPRRWEAERWCGRINPVRLRDSYSPGRTFYRNNEVSFYRPQIRHNGNRGFAPRQFERYGTDRGQFRRMEGRDNGFRRNDDGNNRFNRTAPDRRDLSRRDDRPVRMENPGRRDFRRPEEPVRTQPREQNGPRFDRPDPGERVRQPRDNFRERQQPRRETPSAPAPAPRRFERPVNENPPPSREPRMRENPGRSNPSFERRPESPGRSFDRPESGRGSGNGNGRFRRG